jgi:hypothetical protein
MDTPKMDAPSIALSKVLDDIRVEAEGSPSDYGPMTLVCQSCQNSICEVEDGDTMRVLFNTAINHVCS